MPDENRFDPQVYLELMQTVTRIPIREEWKAGIAQHLATAAKMAEIADAAEIDPNTIDLANVFQVKSP
ncbi:AtzG-like protein [Microbulbifer sp.]|uniref:AtzG-like protein n=1 Tax=Microbulbifer sp. TaxID=1908541 RepID=UPI003F3EAC5C